MDRSLPLGSGGFGAVGATLGATRTNDLSPLRGLTRTADGDEAEVTSGSERLRTHTRVSTDQKAGFERSARQAGIEHLRQSCDSAR